jgi:hypothetical protein
MKNHCYGMSKLNAVYGTSLSHSQDSDLFVCPHSTIMALIIWCCFKYLVAQPWPNTTLSVSSSQQVTLNGNEVIKTAATEYMGTWCKIVLVKK